MAPTLAATTVGRESRRGEPTPPQLGDGCPVAPRRTVTHVGIASFAAARDRVLEITDGGVDPRAVLRGCLEALHEVADFEWAALMGVDPDTILPVSGFIEGFDASACAPFWDAELTLPGYLKFADLARQSDPVGTLYEATDGDLSRAPVYAKLYASLGVADELRAAFVLGSSCWGIVSLVRAEDAGPFTAAEVADVRQLSRFIARALRAATVAESARATGAGVVLFDGDDRVVQATVEARALLDRLRGVEYVQGADDSGAGILRALLARARYSMSGARAVSRFRDTEGSWFRVSAARTDANDGTVVAVFEPARSSDLLSMTLEAYGLTERESHIVRYLARGLSSTEIAAELSLSPHTIRDHVKAVLRKCGAANRGELVARLFADHLRPAMEESVVRAADRPAPTPARARRTPTDAPSTAARS